MRFANKELPLFVEHRIEVAEQKMRDPATARIAAFADERDRSIQKADSRATFAIFMFDSRTNERTFSTSTASAQSLGR